MTSLIFSRFLVAFQAAVVALAAANYTFQVTSGGNDNYFLRDNLTSAQVLLTSANSTASLKRLVVALPAGNSGALTYFLPLNNSSSNASISVTLQNSSLESTTNDFDNVGVQANLTFTGNATLGVTIIGGVRAMRGIPFSNHVYLCPNPLLISSRLCRRIWHDARDFQLHTLVLQ